MNNSDETTWNWQQADGSVFKVVSSQQKGTIIVYDKTGKIVMENKNLSAEQVKLIEQNFLKVVTRTKKSHDTQTPSFDVMIS